MLNKFKNYKLRSQLIIVTVFLSLFIIIMSCILFFNLYELLSSKITSSVDQVFNIIEVEVTDFLEGVESINYTINSNNDIQKIVNTDDADSLNKQFYTLYTNSRGEFNSFFISNKYLENIILSVNGSDLIFNDSKTVLDDVQTLQLNSGEVFCSKLLPDLSDKSSQSSSFFAIVRRIENQRSFLQNKYPGNLSYIINAEFLDNICSKHGITENSHIYIISSRNEIIGKNRNNSNPAIENTVVNYGLNGKNQTTVYVENKRYMLHSRNIGNTGWKLVSMTPFFEYTRELSYITAASLVFVMVFIGFLFLLCFFTISSITNPINSIVRTIEKIRTGNMKSKCEIVSNNEVGEIANLFNLMMNDLNNLTCNIFENQKKLYESELANRNSKLIALQSQINPHLLYNTLTSIQSIAICNKLDDISEMCKALASIFRYSVKGNDFVLVGAEIENLNDYIYIQKLCIGSDISFTYEISPGIMNCVIMKLLLQPFVENAIIHGLLKKTGIKSILIKAYGEGDYIYFEIADNGIGIPADLLEKLNEKVDIGDYSSIQQNAKAYIGVYNVKQRLNIMYGSKYDFNIESSQNKGTKVSIKILRKYGDML